MTLLPIVANPRKFSLSGSELDFSLLIWKSQHERSARTMEPLILAEFNEEPAPMPSSKNMAIGIACRLQGVSRGLRNSVKSVFWNQRKNFDIFWTRLS